MFSTKKEVIDYFDELTNEIDIEFERKIQNLDDNVAISEQNVTRKLFFDKINEIIQFNLEQIGKKVKSCFAFERQNWDYQIIDKKSHDFLLYQPIETTSLIIFNEILSMGSILSLQNKLLDVTFSIEGNFEKNFKLHLIHQLICKSYDAIIDISDSNANLIKQIEITDDSNEINEADLNFGFIDIKKIEGLYLIFPNLRKFSQKIFRNFENLLELDLSIINMRIFSGKFVSFKSLVELRIQIRGEVVGRSSFFDNVLEPNHFKGLNKLKRLLLADNHISDIAENAFSGLESLEFLDLSNNDFKKINGVKLRCLKNLNRLSIANWYEEKLNIDDCDFLKKLKILEIQNNSLVQFQSFERFNQYSNIELIDLTDTACYFLSSIIAFDKIKCLIMENSFSNFRFFRHFENLEFLDLGAHILFDYSQYLNFFENIKILFTCEIIITTFPPVKISFKNLVYLRLYGLVNLEEEFFEDFNSLKYLDIVFDDFDVYNNLTHLNQDQFKYLNELKYLKISYKSNDKKNVVKILEEKKKFLMNLFNPIEEISDQIYCENCFIFTLNHIKIQSCKSPMECFETLKVSEVTKNFLIEKYSKDI